MLALRITLWLMLPLLNINRANAQIPDHKFTITGGPGDPDEWGSITSIGFPNRYPSMGSTYQWELINRDQTGYIQVVFDDFDLAENAAIKFYGASSNYLVRFTPGRRRPTYMNRNDPNMTIVFHSGSWSYFKVGFKLTYHFTMGPESTWHDQPTTAYDRSYIGPSAINSGVYSFPSNPASVDAILVLDPPKGYTGIMLKILEDSYLDGVLPGWMGGNFMEIRQGNTSVSPLIPELDFQHPEDVINKRLPDLYQSPIHIRIRGVFKSTNWLRILFTAFSIYPCDRDQFSCRDGNCISVTLVGNSLENCMDGSDEAAVVTKHPDTAPPVCDTSNICPIQHFLCDGECVGLYKKCDGNFDCNDFSDELSCGSFACCGFVCDSHLCLHRFQICDGSQDCRDGSDEHNCPSPAALTTSKSKTSDDTGGYTVILFVAALGIITCLLCVIIFIMIRKRVLPCCCRNRPNGSRCSSRRRRHGRHPSTHLNLTLTNIASIGLPPTYDEAVAFNPRTGQINMGYSLHCAPPPYSETPITQALDINQNQEDTPANNAVPCRTNDVSTRTFQNDHAQQTTSQEVISKPHNSCQLTTSGETGANTEPNTNQTHPFNRQQNISPNGRVASTSFGSAISTCVDCGESNCELHNSRPSTSSNPSQESDVRTRDPHFTPVFRVKIICSTEV